MFFYYTYRKFVRYTSLKHFFYFYEYYYLILIAYIAKNKTILIIDSE